MHHKRSFYTVKKRRITESVKTTQPKNQTDKISKHLIGSIVAAGALSFIGILTETMMNVLFPSLMTEFSIDAATVQWVTTLYILVTTMFIPLSAWLKKRFTYRTLLMTSVILSLAGTLIGSWSPTFAVLLLARVVQGVAVGIGMPLLFNIILEQSPRSRVGQLMGFGNLVVGLAPALGPTFAGIMTQFIPWRMLFIIVAVILVPFGVLGYVSIQQFFPTGPAKLQLGHLVLIALGLLGLVFGVQQAGVFIQNIAAGKSAGMQPFIALGSLVIGIICMVAFFKVSVSSDDPLLNVRTLRDHRMRWIAFTLICVQVVMLGMSYTIPNFVQMGMGKSSLIGGLVVLPGAMLGAFATPISGAIMDKKGARIPISSGLVAAVLGLCLLGIFTWKLVPAILICFHIVFLIGYCFTYSNSFTYGLQNLTGKEKADGNAIYNTTQQFGASLGNTILGTSMSIFQSVGMAHGSTEAVATTAGAQFAFFFTAAVFVLAGLFIIRSSQAPLKVNIQEVEV